MHFLQTIIEMAINNSNCLLISLTFFLIAFGSNHANGEVLKVGFYHKTCPHVELIVKGIIDDVISRVPSLAAPLLRMHYHDCFVRVCICKIN